MGSGCISLAGLLPVEEFIALIGQAPLVLSVNTGTVHIAAATGTPVIVLYALTNPQHTPWKVPSSVLYFPVTEAEESRNEVVRYMSRQLAQKHTHTPSPQAILHESRKLLRLASVN